MTFVYPFLPIPMTSFPFPFPALEYLRLYSNSDLFPKSNPDFLPFPFPLKQKEFQKILIVVHGEEWFSLEWAHNINHYYSTLVTVHINEVKMTSSGEGLANVHVKWLCLPSSCITEQNLIFYVEKMQWEFIPIPIILFLFPYIVIITPIPVGIPWDPNCSHSHAHL